MDSNTQRTLRYLRGRGFVAEVVERWNPYSKTRKDLFNVIDIVAMGSGHLYGVQSCSDSSRAAHRAKLLREERVRVWLNSGGLFLLITWGKHRGREKGQRRLRWREHVEDITLDMIDAFEKTDSAGTA